MINLNYCKKSTNGICTMYPSSIRKAIFTNVLKNKLSLITRKNNIF